MPRIIYFSDSHLRNTVPACRRDENFYQVQFDKLNQINDFIEENHINYVLHGGDLFDSHYSPSPVYLQLVNDVIQLVQKSKAKWIINPGNHDIFGETTETLPRSGLGLLKTSGAATVVDKVTDFDLGNAVVRFIPRGCEKDSSLFFFPKIEEGKVYLILPHMLLVPHFVPYPHTLISDVKTNADIVCCSDYHGQFREKHGNSLFINGGPLTRQSTSEKNLQPGFVYIDVGAHKAEIVRLKSKQASEVMDLTIDDRPEMKVAEDFLKVLQSSTFEASDRSSLVRQIGAEMKVNEHVVDATIERVKSSESLLEA